MRRFWATMTHKLSAQKVSKILSLYFAGYTETEIGSKLKVAQSTVSMYVAQFKSLVEQHGPEAAAQALGIADQVNELHSLTAELKDANLTVPEARAGLNTHIALWKHGISPDKYKDLVHACGKMKDTGYLEAAMKLSNLEHSTGMTYQEIVSAFEVKHKKLGEANNELQTITAHVANLKTELATLQEQEGVADQSLKEQLDKLGLDMSRLALVEGLALTLKEGGIKDSEISTYVARQKALDKYCISLDNLLAIAKQAKVMTADDGGKSLAEKLSEFGSLDAAIEARQNKLNLLTQETAGLEEKAKIKAKIETDIVKLKAERAAHQSVVTELAASEKKLAKTQHDVTDSLHKQEGLIQDIKKREERRDQLDNEIVDKEQKVSDLSELEAKRNTVSATLDELEAKKKLQVTEREVFESFLGVVGSSLSLEAMEKCTATVPQLFALAKAREYSPELLRSAIIRNLSGGTLEILHCNSCQARFYVDKPAETFYKRHNCQHCGSPLIETVVDGPEIIKTALAALAPHMIMVTPVTGPKGAPQNNPGQPESHN
jgi:predicted transcriptional regulator/NAD-dependent SIR2 family protein deacetylase